MRRLEGEHAKLVSQLKHAEATISEYIVVSTAQLDSVVNEQRVAFELEAKSLREQLQGNTTRVAQLQEALTVSLERYAHAKEEFGVLEADSSATQEQCMKEVQRVTDELAVRNAALEKAQRELTELESQMARYENQTSTLISKEDVSSTEAIERDARLLQEANDKLQQDLEGAQAEREKLSSRLAVAEEERAMRREESLKFQTAAADAERARSEAESKRAALEEEITRMQAEVEKAQALRTEAERAKAEAEGRRELALRAVEELSLIHI